MNYKNALEQLKYTEDKILTMIGTRKISKIDSLIQQVLNKNHDINKELYDLVEEYMNQYIEVGYNIHKHPELQQEFDKIRGW